MPNQTDKEFLIRVRADIDSALKDLRRLPGVIGDTGKQSKQAGSDINSMGRSLQFLTRAAAGYFSIRTVATLVRQADQYNILSSRIRTATKDTGDYAEVQRQLFDISQRNGQQMATSVSLFQSLARSAPELQTTNEEVLKLVDLVQQLGVISGASQSSLSAGLLQFSQGLAAGVFRAEEFNSLLENIPEVANRIARGLGVTVGQLRQMVLDGKLLSRDVFDSLLKQSGEISQEFSSIPDSIERSVTRLNTSFSKFLDTFDEGADATGFINRFINNLSKTFDAASARLRIAFFGVNKGEVDRGGTDGVGNIGQSTDPVTPNEDQDDIDKIIGKLQEQADNYGKTTEQIALYRLELLGATEEEKAIASALITTTEAKRQHDAVMEEGRRVYESTRTDMERLANTIADLQQKYEQGAFGEVGSEQAFDTLSRAIFNAEEEFNSLEEKGAETFSGLEAAVRGWGDQFTNTLADMVQQGKLNFSSLADAIISDLLRIMIYQQITAPLFGGLGLPGFSAPVQHDGGFAGTGPRRNVSPLLFAGAQRYHSGGYVGLRSDEVPAILQKGELVLSKEQVQSAGAGGNMRVEIVNRGSGKQVTDVQATSDISGEVLRIVVDDIDRGGTLRSRIKTVSNE